MSAGPQWQGESLVVVAGLVLLHPSGKPAGPRQDQYPRPHAGGAKWRIRKPSWMSAGSPLSRKKGSQPPAFSGLSPPVRCGAGRMASTRGGGAWVGVWEHGRRRLASWRWPGREDHAPGGIPPSPWAEQEPWVSPGVYPPTSVGGRGARVRATAWRSSPVLRGQEQTCPAGSLRNVRIDGRGEPCEQGLPERGGIHRPPGRETSTTRRTADQASSAQADWPQEPSARRPAPLSKASLL